METVHSKLDALLEIGTEEIPASYVPPALSALKSRTLEFLDHRRLPNKGIIVWGTPRRMAIHITGLPARSEGTVSEAMGPSLAAAKDPQGNWTRAATGFAQSQGVPVGSLQVRSTKKGDYVCAVKKIEGVRTDLLLTDLFTGLIPEVPFPKKMVWNESQVRFARPIRNLVCLYGHKVLRLNVAGIKSTNKTFGLSHLAPKNIVLQSPQNYVTSLKNHCVIVDPAARKESIRNLSSQLAKRVKGSVKTDETLLEELTWLVEHPVAILGEFDSEFLSVPQELLMTCMKKQQKFFSIVDASEKIMPYFVGIRNGISEYQETVRGGYEGVLRARLYDAKFFYEEDIKKSPEVFAQKAAGITVNERVGSIADRIARMSGFAAHAAGMINQSNARSRVDVSVVERAIRLAKFDLVTRVVYEFPELQGIMGEKYAIRSGEDPRVARAIREHYYPLTNQGLLPSSPESSLVAISEKCDTLAGSMFSGYTPSGSGDPFGLRRQSTGILRIILNNDWDLPLRDLVSFTLDQFSGEGRNGSARVEDILKDILSFLTDRFQLLMQDAGYELDEIYSVTRNEGDPDSKGLMLISLREKIAALHAVRQHPDFNAVAGAYKRAGNILRQARQKKIDYSKDLFNVSLLREPAEEQLHSVVLQLDEKIKPLIEQKQYKEVLQRWVAIRGDLDQFFEKVLVMDQDEKICVNRLSLLSMLESHLKQVADFSLIQNRS